MKIGNLPDLYNPGCATFGK